MSNVTAQQQINLLQLLQQNADNIIANTNYTEDYNISEEDNDDAYSVALTSTAANMLDINERVMQDILDKLHFTCTINTSLIDTMRYILCIADINDLIDEVMYTYDIVA